MAARNPCPESTAAVVPISGHYGVDLFRVESILLRSHWVMLVMDVFTRRIIGFGVERAYIDGISICRMFN